jgi:hypothetical protein
MPSFSLNVERVWAVADGTICLMVEREEAPRFEVCVLRGEDVLRQDRLYSRATARVMAETWRLAYLDAPSAPAVREREQAYAS